MNRQQLMDYELVAQAIHFINENYLRRPSLEKIAKSVHLSISDFQQLISNWAGVDAQKFLQYISVSHNKAKLTQQLSLFDSTKAIGTINRIHHASVSIEVMTPKEHHNGGENISIAYSYASSPFGKIIIASTPKGICYMAFGDHEEVMMGVLKNQFPNADYTLAEELYHHQVLSFFQKTKQPQKIRLHIKGTNFQLKVWEALLKIPLGQLTTYGTIANQIGNKNASRAVGTAVGDNPISFIIPCHRVVQSSGAIGGYMWGPVRKAAMIGWEAAQVFGAHQ